VRGLGAEGARGGAAARRAQVVLAAVQSPLLAEAKLASVLIPRMCSSILLAPSSCRHVRPRPARSLPLAQLHPARAVQLPPCAAPPGPRPPSRACAAPSCSRHPAFLLAPSSCRHVRPRPARAPGLARPSCTAARMQRRRLRAGLQRALSRSAEATPAAGTLGMLCGLQLG